MINKQTENFDELVFEKRNKEYGAYYIRVIYKKYLTRSVLVSLLSLVLAVGIPFLIFKQANTANVDKTVSTEFADLNKKAIEDVPPPPPPPPPEEALEQKVKFVAPIVTTDTAEVDKGDVMNQDVLAQNTTNTAPVDEQIEVKTDVAAPIETVKPPPFTVVEEMPSYPGGEESLQKYLVDNIKYPQLAKETNITGRVFIYFVIEGDGSVSEARVVRGIGGGCDEEALRVVKAMPKWTPGRQAGKPVRVMYNLPVLFNFN